MGPPLRLSFFGGLISFLENLGVGELSSGVLEGEQGGTGGLCDTVDQAVHKAWLGGGEMGQGKDFLGVRGDSDGRVAGHATERVNGSRLGKTVVVLQSIVGFRQDEVGHDEPWHPGRPLIEDIGCDPEQRKRIAGEKPDEDGGVQ